MNVTVSDPIPIVGLFHTYLIDINIKKIRGGDIEKLFEIVLYETIPNFGATYRGMSRNLAMFLFQSGYIWLNICMIDINILRK